MVRIATLAAAFFIIAAAMTSVRASENRHADQLSRGARMLAAYELYQNNCASCHGKNGEGDGRTVNFASPQAVANLTRGKMLDSLTEPHAAHGANVRERWKSAITVETAAAVIDFIRDAFMLPAPVADASLGRRIYARTCSVCHGERGNGASWAKNGLNPPPADFTTEKVARRSRKEMVNTVVYGRPNTAMMPFATRFSRQEIAAVVDYVRRTFMKTAAPAPGHHSSAAQGEHAEHGMSGEFDMAAPFPRNLVGDFQRGKRFYNATCNECHGTTGAGDGRRAYFMRKKPRDFTAAKARAELNRPHLFAAIAKGIKRTEMSAWSKVIDDQQIADVGEYVFRAFTGPSTGPAAGPAAGDKHPAPAWHAPVKKK